MIKMDDVKVSDNAFEVELYKVATSTVTEELFSLNVTDGTIGWRALEELATVAMARCKGVLLVSGISVICDGIAKFSVNGLPIFSRSGLISGWYSWFTRDFAAWSSWGVGRHPVMVVVPEDLRFSRCHSWKSADSSVDIKGVKDGIATAMIDGSVVEEPLERILGAIAMYGLKKAEA